MAGRAPTSKTALTAAVKQLSADAVLAGLDAKPDLLAVRDDRGRNWLHLTASIDVLKKRLDPAASVRLADGLLARGIDVNEPAFTEDGGRWQATPLWYAVARGRNRTLAEFLLGAGSTPEHCLWAASFNEDEDMVRLLVAAGATVDAVTENETPLLGAVKWSRFGKVGALLECGANPDWIDPKGMTCLHYMLKKGTEPRHFDVFIRHKARGDIPGPDGRTAIDILRRKRDPVWHELADALAAND